MRKLFIGAIVLLVLIVTFLIFAGIYTDRLLDPYVRTLLEQHKPMHHKVSYEKIKVNLFTRHINIRNVKFLPKDSLDKEKKIWMDITVSTIRLTDFNIWKMLANKALSIGDLEILKPDVVVHLPLNPAENIIDSVQANNSERAKILALKSVSLERILISEGGFKLIRNNVILVSSPDINLLSEQIKLATNNKGEPIGYKYAKMKLSLSDISIHSESGLYNLSVDSFSANKEDSTIILNGFRMIPKYDKKEFSMKLEFQDDRFDVSIRKIKIEGIGAEQLQGGKPLRISTIRLDDVDADIYRDKNVAFNINKFPLFHNEMFLKLKLPFYLDTLAITNSRIQYGELDEERAEPGTIILEDFDLWSYNLTNQTEEDPGKNEMRLNIIAKVMGEGNLNAELVLPLEGNLKKISCNGSVGKMDLAPLNSMLEPSMNIKFKGGQLKRMTFSFTGNNNRSNGWMEFLYNDLNVELLKKNPGKQWRFVSLLANSMAVSNNPSHGKDLKIVKVGFERNKNKGLINYIWKTIQSGMIHTIVPTSKYKIKQKPVKKVENSGTAKKETSDNKKKEKEKEKDKDKKKKKKRK